MAQRRKTTEHTFLLLSFVFIPENSGGLVTGTKIQTNLNGLQVSVQRPCLKYKIPTFVLWMFLIMYFG
jgi:hypothetical protein